MTPLDYGQLLIASNDDLRTLVTRLCEQPDADTLFRDAAELSLAARAALASSIAAERPHVPASVVIARHRRRWRFRALFWGVFAPLGVTGLVLFGLAFFGIVTAFFWRP